MVLEQSVLMTWWFLAHESSRDSLVEIKHLRKELSCQARYMKPRELGAITENPQTMETFAVLNFLMHPGNSSCLKGHT